MGLDHSEEMVGLSRERAPGADVVLGSAERLPFSDASFSAVAASIVFFFFLADGAGFLAECRRVLAAGGRLALYTTAPGLRGTPAAPEPLASRAYFYESTELAELARTAGLTDVAVDERDGGSCDGGGLNTTTQTPASEETGGRPRAGEPGGAPDVRRRMRPSAGDDRAVWNGLRPMHTRLEGDRLLTRLAPSA